MTSLQVLQIVEPTFLCGCYLFYVWHTQRKTKELMKIQEIGMSSLIIRLEAFESEVARLRIQLYEMRYQQAVVQQETIETPNPEGRRIRNGDSR